jgi:catechol 2,3-dioxygenase-like lactoylglutathione lyase family enzyme
MGSTLLGIDHVALRALDLAKTERFYGEILGLPVVEKMGGVSQEWDDHAWEMRIFALPSGQFLDFFAVEGAPEPPRLRPAWLETIQHLALRVGTRTELEGWRKQLKRHAIPILEEHDHGEGRHSLYVRDPNGHYLELTCRA